MPKRCACGLGVEVCYEIEKLQISIWKEQQ